MKTEWNIILIQIMGVSVLYSYMEWYCQAAQDNKTFDYDKIPITNASLQSR